MKFTVTDYTSGDCKTIDAKTPKQAAIEYLKQDCVEGNPNHECSWDLVIRKVKGKNQ